MHERQKGSQLGLVFMATLILAAACSREREDERVGETAGSGVPGATSSAGTSSSGSSSSVSGNAGRPTASDGGATSTADELDGGAGSAAGARSESGPGGHGGAADEASAGSREQAAGESTGPDVGGRSTAGSSGNGGTSGNGGSGRSGSGSGGAAGSSGNSAESGGAPDGSGGTSPAGTLPCDVRAVLESRCQTCHRNPPVNLAPMSLLTWEAVHTYADAIQEKLDTDSMPPPGAPDLSEAQLSTLLVYVSLGAPSAGNVSCP